MKKDNLILDKSFHFSLMMIELYKQLKSDNEFVLSKHLLRSATSIGANVHELSAVQSKSDFIHKMAIAPREARKTRYWLTLHDKSDLVHPDHTTYLKEID